MVGVIDHPDAGARASVVNYVSGIVAGKRHGTCLLYTSYSITGAMVRSHSDSTDGLAPGVYIVNGHKTIVR